MRTPGRAAAACAVTAVVLLWATTGSRTVDAWPANTTEEWFDNTRSSVAAVMATTPGPLIACDDVVPFHILATMFDPFSRFSRILPLDDDLARDLVFVDEGAEWCFAEDGSLIRLPDADEGAVRAALTCWDAGRVCADICATGHRRAKRNGRAGRVAQNQFERNVVVVGGCGHVGLPLGIAFADAGLHVAALRPRPARRRASSPGAEMPFAEPGAECSATVARATGAARCVHRLAVVSPRPRSSSSSSARRSTSTSTPIRTRVIPARHARSAISSATASSSSCAAPSTRASPRLVEQLVAASGLQIDVAFCPERIAEGKAFTELYELPQIVSGRTESAVAASQRALRPPHRRRSSSSTPEEAELAKLFTNTWRYIKFAAANQFFMIANDFGLDFERIRHAITLRLPARRRPAGAGFAAGPCLFKDTMQLAAFNNNNFTLGHASMMVNEGLPLYIVSRMEQPFDLPSCTVGILGMAFKAESDDIALEPVVQAPAHPALQGRARCCAPTRTSRPTRPLPLDEVLARGRRAGRRRAARCLPHARHLACRSSTSGTSSVAACAYDGHDAAVVDRHPCLQRG